MEDRLEIWLELLAGKLDRLIELGENIERAIRSHEMPEEWGEHEGDHFAGADKMVSEEPAKEPPKKWRILHPGESVRASDWENEDLNSETDPPDGPGWRPASMWKNGRSVLKDDKCIYARPVADEPAKEPEHPAGPMPDPGEGYRILSKNPPEDLTPGDECEDANGGWTESDNARTHGRQEAMIWYRRKIGFPAKEPGPAWEPKVGDWVRVTRPVDWKEWKDPLWREEMHIYDGKVFEFVKWSQSSAGQRASLQGIDWFFHRDWLSPAEPPKPAWEPNVGDWVKVTKPKKQDRGDDPIWLTTMDQYDGKVFQVKKLIRLYQWPSVMCDGINCAFKIDWLSPAEPPKDEYREPVLPADAGKYCQFSDDGIEWRFGWLDGCVQRSHQWISHSGEHWRHCRIKKES